MMIRYIMDFLLRFLIYFVEVVSVRVNKPLFLGLLVASLIKIVVIEGRENPYPETICDVCLKNEYDTPFYCAIKPDLPQCIFPSCPKICDAIENDPTLRHKAPPASPQKRKSSHPVYLPKLPPEQYSRFLMGRSLDTEAGNSKKTPSGHLRYMALGRTVGGPEPVKPYNPLTCELPSPNLRRIRPDSKYIEYRSPDPTHQIKDILKIAENFGLFMAEFHHVSEWIAVEQSSILQIVSTYTLTKENPRFYYAIGVKDQSDHGKKITTSNFKYSSNNESIGFFMLDPRVYGRKDEQCAVLSHVIGTDKKQYLTTRMYNCNANMGDGLRVVNGLMMFPPDSICYRRSEEECGYLTRIKTGEEDQFHSLIQIGQSIKRFIYLYTDQMSWDEAKAFCSSKDLKLLDFDQIWDDALRVAEVIEHFLREGQLNPVSTFWTSGRFDYAFSDGKFKWTSTASSYLNTEYKLQAPPFPFAWWNDQDVGLEEMNDKSQFSRRNDIDRPCVALALNPQDGGDRPKLNFMAWYCNFPMTFLCYKELTPKDELGAEVYVSASKVLTRPAPASDSCEDSPTSPDEGESTEEIKKPEPEIIEPFDLKTCSSKSLTAKRILPNSKFVSYQPTLISYSVEEIKEQCKKFGLIPAEIRTREDWDSIKKSGIAGTVSNLKTTRYFFVIGMDDTEIQGEIRYNSDGGKLTFSLFTTDGSTNINDRCTVLESVADPSGKSRGLIMVHINCKLGLNSEDKIAYGLCMFPKDSKCYIESIEEIAAVVDPGQFILIIALGVTDSRSIFLNPVQRTWDEAVAFCESANLKLLDFDVHWRDTQQVLKIFVNKLVTAGGFFQLTPIWTSGKLNGLYKDKSGTWTTTNNKIELSEGVEWLHDNAPNLDQIREGVIQNGCLEASFDDLKRVVRLRPDYCDVPKYFLCYRKTNRRPDPKQKNSLGITLIVEDFDVGNDDGRDGWSERKKLGSGDGIELVSSETNGDDEEEQGSTIEKGKNDDAVVGNDDDDQGFFIEKSKDNFVPLNSKSFAMSEISRQHEKSKQFDMEQSEDEIRPGYDDEDYDRR